MTTLVPITLTCSVCGSEFDSCAVGSCGFGSKRTDMRPNFWGLNPAEYYYHLCPNCGYCSGESAFESKIEDQSLLDSLKALGVLEKPSLSEKIERALICIDMVKEKDGITVDNWLKSYLWMQTFWWANGPVEEERYGKITLNIFHAALKEGSVPDTKIQFVNYIIGEINRRIGNIDEAKRYFDLVIASGDEDLTDLAKQQRDDPKDRLEQS